MEIHWLEQSKAQPKVEVGTVCAREDSLFALANEFHWQRGTIPLVSSNKRLTPSGWVRLDIR